MPRLVAQSPEFEGKTFDLSGPEVTVGRVADNRIQIEHASVSGHHATFKLDQLDYVIKDLDSTNGTRINGERITQQKLRRNDILRLGNIELLYDSEHAPPGQPMPQPSERVKSQRVRYAWPAAAFRECVARRQAAQGWIG